MEVEKYNEDEISEMSKQIEIYRKERLDVIIESLPSEPECNFWIMGNSSIPCGGTHVNNSAELPEMKIRRKSKSKGLQRIYYEVESTDLNDPMAPYAQFLAQLLKNRTECV